MAYTENEIQDLIELLSQIEQVKIDILKQLSDNSGTLYYRGRAVSREKQVIKGVKGDPGKDGTDGQDGINGQDGIDGLSAYEVAVENGFIGNEIEWLQSLIGQQGIQGVEGIQGIQGIQGNDGINGTNGINGVNGEDGLSAYQIAVNSGFVGTELEWVQSLKGEQGEPGIQGIQGVQGIQGETGLQGLQGEQGETGLQGIQGEQGLQGVQGIQGTDGTNGVGVPVGGVTGQVLAKINATDYNTEWVDVSGGVLSVNDQTGVVVLDKTDIGLSNVDNTSDTNKPISTATQTALDNKADNPTRKKALILETDCYGNAAATSFSPFLGGAQSSGSAGMVAPQANHPGIVVLRDSTSSNGGYRIMTDAQAILISGGETHTATWQVRSVRAGIKIHIGFFDVTSNTTPVDCVFLIGTSDGVTVSLTPRARANNTAQSLAPFTPTLNTWYTSVITINADATGATIEIFTDDGTNVFTSGTLTNIPTASGRQTGAGVAVFENSTNAAAEILWLDYMRLEINRTLLR